MNSLTSFQVLMPILPEVVLAVGAMVLLMLGVFAGDGAARFVNGLCILLLIAVAACVVMLPSGRAVLFDGSFVVDDFARFLKILMLSGAAGTLILSLDYLTNEKLQKAEFGVLVLLATLGMMLLISASDLIALYLGLELMSLPLYVIAASNRDNARSTEAGLEVLRSRRAVVRHAAVWRLADLRLHRHGQLRRHCQGDAGGRGGTRPDLRSGVPVRRILVQGLGCSVPHVDAGRL